MRYPERALKSSEFPGNLESRMYVQGCAYSWERPKKALISHLWLAMQEMKAMAEL